uniref:FA complementation group D2 n=1 Tax=Falco tinnunculus TaxID=100819 RepID=A0A8C4V601_FALTI
MAFQKKLCLALEKHPTYPGQFISGLESHIKDRNQFKNCLLPCTPVRTEGSRSAKLLSLSVCLTDLCFAFCCFSVGTFGTNFPRLIVNQFKWLDGLLDSQDLVKKLIQMVSVSPVPIQHDIITSLPEILEDSQQSEVARELSCLLKQGRRLTVPILDALSRLDLDAGLLAEVRQSAMTIVPSVKLEDLPVVVKFILHNVKAADAVEVISDLRKNLDLSSCVLPLQILGSQKKLKSQVQASSSMSQVTTSQNCVKLLFDVIKLAVRFQKDVSESWIKAIENSTSVSDHKVLDLIVLLLIHSTNTKNRKQTEKVLKSKIQLGCMPEQLMQNAFQNHSVVIKEFFPSILALAQTFLHSAHPAVVSFGSCMYKQAFAAFDSYCQQEVVTALVTHVCSGNETELDISLDVLTDLVMLHTSLLMRYATFVKVCIFLGKLNPCQIRKLFYILSTLAFSQRQEGSYIQDDMHMVIRKWLSSTVPNHKQMGVIEKMYLIEKQKGNLDLKLLVSPRWMGITEFVSKSLSVCPCSSFLFPVKSLYNLDEDESQGAIAINLLPLVSQSELGPTQFNFSLPSRVVSPMCLSPCFRLLRLYTGEQNSGSLEEIDALLGCPLYLTDLEVEGKLDSLSTQEREFLCSLLFYALNWFREVVNAFCQQQDAEMKGKVLTRLQNITELQNVLGKCLAGEHESFVHSGPVPAVKRKGLKKKTDGSKAGSADRSPADDSSEGNQPDAELSELEKTAAEREAGTPLAWLQSYRPYFRELDLEVFTVLHCGLLTKSVLDAEMHTEACEVVQLGPAELCFLLDDLCWKLEHVLTPGSTRRVPFPKASTDIGFSHLCQRSPKEVAMCVVKLLKPLCNHMENMHNYFQAVTQNRDVGDEPGVNIQEHQLMSFCYQQLLLTFRSLFAWNGFSRQENTDLLRSALQVLAERLKPGETEFLLLEELISDSFHYLLNFQQSVPSFYCAFILTQLLIAIAEKPMAGWKKEKMASLAKQFLCQSWVKPSGDREKGSQFNSALHTLLCVYLEHADNILKAIEEISSVGVPELINSAKDGCSSTYPTLSRQTFPVFFRVMMAQLESSVKSIPAGKPSDSSEYGRLFVEAFLKLAMPLLDYSFKKHRDDVQSLLKNLQLSTRQLHHMCGHSKIHQDIGLTNHVPLLKKSLEQFVYRVKAMLAFNHCQEAFWVGILKNRDLQGEEILSQASEGRHSGEEEEDSADSAAEVPAGRGRGGRSPGWGGGSPALTAASPQEPSGSGAGSSEEDAAAP